MRVCWLRWLIGCVLCGAAVANALAQLAQQPAATAVPPSSLEILSFKIVSYYNPLLARSDTQDADTRDLPRTPAEQASRARRTTPPSHQERANEIGIAPGAAPNLKVLSSAEWVYLTVKNTAAQPIKTLVWEYAFLRVENGQLVTRASVTSQTEIKPGAKKTFRQPLPAGATRCQVVDARAARQRKPFEYVCGRGFTDPSLLRELLEPVAIKRLEYANGAVWPQP